MSLNCVILQGMKRKDRYLGMFQKLPPSIRTEKKRVRFKNEIEWSMNHLKKDDRIIWYLSILQRFIMLQIRSNNEIPEDTKYNKWVKLRHHRQNVIAIGKSDPTNIPILS